LNRCVYLWTSCLCHSNSLLSYDREFYQGRWIINIRKGEPRLLNALQLPHKSEVMWPDEGGLTHPGSQWKNTSRPAPASIHISAASHSQYEWQKHGASLLISNFNVLNKDIVIGR
jgi:hypothetical protein